MLAPYPETNTHSPPPRAPAPPAGRRPDRDQQVTRGFQSLNIPEGFFFQAQTWSS